MTVNNAEHATVIIGANSAIAQATIEQITKLDQTTQIIGISRSPPPQTLSNNSRLNWLVVDHSAASIAEAADRIKQLPIAVTRAIICVGVLHTADFSPEKSLRTVDPDVMQQVIHTNAVLPVLWLQALLPLLQHKHHCVISVLSARVGSISDNRLGGWYSYRASKAALNMLLKTASIEYARRAPNTKLIAFHPGTVNTPLSQPFQKGVPEGKLFEPTFVAERLLRIMAKATKDRNISYVDWNNKPIDW